VRENSLPGWSVENLAIGHRKLVGQPACKIKSNVRFSGQAGAIRGKKNSLTTIAQQPSSLLKYLFLALDMFDHVASIYPLKLPVIKWSLFRIATDQFHVGETGFIKPLSGQNQPTHGDI
jgi:hypothetical protein